MSGRWRVLALSALFFISSVGCRAQSPQLNSSPQPSTANPGASAALAQNSYADVVSRVSPAVVTVRSTQRNRPSQQFPFMDDPFFRDFFGDRLPQQPQPPRRSEGLGSGVLVSPDGYILTNHHVVDGALEIRVELTDRRSFPAKLVGSDPPSDLAVLKIESTNLPVLALGNSDQTRVGDVVLAIGNPLGIGQTVTSGIISAKGRATGLSDGSFEDFIQTDAAINRGNSGGALVNTNGELIGINSQILSPSGGNIGIGFAIPSNMARAVMDQLMKTGKVRRGMVGVTIQTVTSDVASSLNLPAARGAIVSSVQAGGPAATAGVQRGDVIIAVNDQPVADSNGLRNLIASTAPGTEITLTILREGRESKVRVRLAELPARATEDSESGGGSGEGSDRFGLSLQPLTPEIARQLQMNPNEQGLVVMQIDPAGAAAQAGISRGDVIQAVNRQVVRSVADFNAALARSGTRPALILVNRRGNVIFLTLRPR